MSTPDENQPMREALHRDAARVLKPDFDPALHYATMRRLRGSQEKPALQFRMVPALAAAAMLALATFLVLWQMHFLPKDQPASQSQSGPPQHAPVPSPVFSATTITRSSLITYQVASEKSDGAFLALLDRDARELLPESAPIFSVTLQ